FVRDHTPGGGTRHGSSISPHSIARPQRLSSIEYTFSFVAVMGMPWSYAYRMQSSRVIPHERTGAIVSRSGASARVDTSKRTWSLPFPVQPWATASAPCFRAAATRCLTMMGRDRDDTSGYLPSYLAFAFSAGATYSLAYSSRQSS